MCPVQDGHTALHLAVRRCQVEVVRCLLRHQCNVDKQDRHGNTPLHVASKDGNLPVVVAICSAKASLDLPNKVRRVFSCLVFSFIKGSVLSNAVSV